VGLSLGSPPQDEHSNRTYDHSDLRQNELTLQSLLRDVGNYVLDTLVDLDPLSVYSSVCRFDLDITLRLRLHQEHRYLKESVRPM
jgi:hypothetical protein